MAGQRSVGEQLHSWPDTNSFSPVGRVRQRFEQLCVLCGQLVSMCLLTEMLLCWWVL